MNGHIKPALNIFAVVALASGAAHAQNHDAWVAKENAATAAVQKSADAERMEAATKVCAKVRAYWAENHKPFNMDSCLNDPTGAQQAVTADKNATAQAEYQRQQELHRQQEATYAQQQAEYQKQMTEYRRHLAEAQEANSAASSQAGPPQ